MEVRKWAMDVLRWNGLHVDTKEKIIFLPRVGPGLKVWGAIDCLCNYFKFRKVRERDAGFR